MAKKVTIEQKVSWYKKAIVKGVAALDKKFGKKKWLKEIDEEILNLGDVRACVCGQVFGTYGAARFGRKIDMSKEFAIAHGFEKNYEGFANNNNDYDLLTRLWHMKIVELKLIRNLYKI